MHPKVDIEQNAIKCRNLNAFRQCKIHSHVDGPFFPLTFLRHTSISVCVVLQVTMLKLYVCQLVYVGVPRPVKSFCE